MADSQLHNTLGALLDGAIVANLLFGIFVIQVHFYYRRFPQDQRSLKILVAVVWFLEVSNTVCVACGIYVAAIRQRRHILDALPKSFRIGYFFGCPAGPVVQAFFITRVAKCFDKPYLAILCWTMTFLRFLGGLWLASVFLNYPMANQQWLLTTSIVLEASVDLLIAASLCYFLVKSRHHSVHKRTIRLLDKLIAMTLRTGLITSLISIIVIICYVMMPETCTQHVSILGYNLTCNPDVWLAIMICQAKVSSNSMLAALNGRSMRRGDHERDTEAFGNAESKTRTFDRSSMEFTTNINIGTVQVSEVLDV